MKKVVYNRLIEYLTTYNLLPSNQHGFHTGKNTISAVTELIEFVINAMYKKETVISIFMDLTKAFDNVCHAIVIYKLN